MSDEAQQRTRASLLQRLRSSTAPSTAREELVTRYGPYVRSWCQHWRLQAAASDDVVQAVLLQLWKQLRTFEYDPGRSFRGLLRTIAFRVWHDLRHGQQRAIPGSGDSAVGAALETTPDRDDLAARLEAAYDREVLDLATERVRARIEERTWEAFRLTALEGCSGADAARLGVQIGAIFKAKSRVQEMLRSEVALLEQEAR